MNTQNTNDNSNIFYAETIEGYSFKVLFEILEKNFPSSDPIRFKVNKNGIFINMVNENLIIDASFYGKFMNEFEYNYQEEEFLFGVPISDLIKQIKKKIKKKDILSLSVKENRILNISIFDSSYSLPILGIQNYINEIPQGYYDRPINLNNSKLLSSLWKKIKTNDDGVNIQLMKNTLKLSFHDIPSILIGEKNGLEILYEDTFKKELISNIIKISSFGTLRIYYSESTRSLLFSTIVGCASGNINLYITPDFFQ